MKRLGCTLALLGLFAFSGTVLGADAKTYQVTGPVLEVTDTTIVVQKGDEKWELARDKGTKANGAIKVGTKVTIQYQMVAKEVEVKADKPAKAEKKDKK